MPFSTPRFLSKCISSWISWGLWGIISLKIFWVLEHFVGSRCSVRYCGDECITPGQSSPTPLHPHHALLCCPTFSSCRDCFHHHPNQVAYECYICVIRARVINFPQAWRTIPCIWLSSIVWSGASLLGWNNHILDMHGPGCTGDWPSKDTCHSSFVFVSWLPDGVIAHCYGHILFSIQNVSWRLWTPLPQGVLSRNFPSEENHSSPTAGAALGDFLFDKILHDESLS